MRLCGNLPNIFSPKTYSYIKQTVLEKISLRLTLCTLGMSSSLTNSTSSAISAILLLTSDPVFLGRFSQGPGERREKHELLQKEKVVEFNIKWKAVLNYVSFYFSRPFTGPVGINTCCVRSAIFPERSFDYSSSLFGRTGSRKQISMLTWNIWFSPVKMQKRMKALGQLVQDLEPDILAFQEVTLENLGLLRKQEWFARYHMIPPDVSKQGSYFVIILSVFPVDKWFVRPFKNSPYFNRKLVTAETVVKKVWVSSSHNRVWFWAVLV